MQSNGVMDTDLSNLTLDDLMKHGIANLADETKEHGYIVRHGLTPVSEFGRNRTDHEENPSKINPLAGAYPTLFPYGVGLIEGGQQVKIGFEEHVRWVLQYHDRRFRKHRSFPFVVFGIQQKRDALTSARIQMRRRDFQRDAMLLTSLTFDDLREAEREEANNQIITNSRVSVLHRHVFATASHVKGSNQSRANYRSQIWGTCLTKGGPSLWITINPSDTHDPVAQIFAGCDIDMDQFSAHLGPNNDQRARNMANDPYASAQYFFFIIEAVLRCLFQVSVTKYRVHSGNGVLGRISAYFGVVEAQGRGALHVHMLLWLEDTPNTDEVHELLQTEEFREKLKNYIRQNIRAHFDGINAETIPTIPKESALPYSRPPNPDSERWEAECADIERRVVRSQQVHVCSNTTCLRFDQYGKKSCKRRAPFQEAEDDFVELNGEWGPKRTCAMINNYCPTITVNLRCNNGIKLITNGSDTKDIAWYSTDYETKPQGKNYNVSALMAKALLYHEQHCEKYKDHLDRNRMLLFRCQSAMNREMELSGPQVMAYLMGWNDTFCSHHYVPLYWSSMKARLMEANPDLCQRMRDR